MTFKQPEADGVPGVFGMKDHVTFCEAWRGLPGSERAGLCVWDQAAPGCQDSGLQTSLVTLQTANLELDCQVSKMDDRWGALTFGLSVATPQAPQTPAQTLGPLSDSKIPSLVLHKLNSFTPDLKPLLTLSLAPFTRIN